MPSEYSPALPLPGTSQRRRVVGKAFLLATFTMQLFAVLVVHGEQQTLAQKGEIDQDQATEPLVGERESQAAEAVSADLDDLDALLDKDLGQLAREDVVLPVFSEPVTTVARQESTVGRSPAAVYVITGEMIRRSGARSIPEVLRLVPGVQVARIDANKWAISIRGSNQRFANKLLVQIDGRTVYTPLFAGVFWELQDVLLEDIARIEIIRGPGASVWGANAVNGVINIITESATETTGVFAEAGAGEERRFASARHGGGSGRRSWRVYGKWFDREGGLLPSASVDDDWHMTRFGFRTDWQPHPCDRITFQGDYYDGDAGQYQFVPTPVAPFLATGPDRQQLSGWNAVWRWTHTVDTDSDWTLQFYYDRTERSLTGVGFQEDRDTADVDFQHRFRWREWHSVIWGLGYRNTRDQIRNTPFFLQFAPTSRADDRFSVTAQDEMVLLEDRLTLTVGSKLSWNDYTGFEIQPTARLLYTPSNRRSLWASVSRAVRVPSRANDDVRLISAPSSVPVFPTFPTILGNRGLASERLLAWELGMRAAPAKHFYWDVAFFYNQYDDNHTLAPGVPALDPLLGEFTLPLNFTNEGQFNSCGVELASAWQPTSAWKLRGAYSFLRLPAAAGEAAGESPRNQFFLHSSWDLGCDWESDVVVRYADELGAMDIPSYTELDARIAWRPTAGLEVALIGRNLLDRAHLEFGDDTTAGVFATEVEREVFGSITYRR